ncbi:hypothetical protein LHV13_04965 [Ferrovum sp. PN-J185]|uniref:hypothetical protein n=1 Tax=Ferrovum sp. PN-J185 TaxID=1356306 RepID=UPI000793B8DE|nr:hypothetical protein [Ferrovum sp. PN-J185]KXW55777.1 hypothetical protein FV185_15460 [Ferrovum sp. PN-J185]MCC6068525.1 hypothetical protein [Ferrovum sp. PN-J185]MDE1892162.1 hypothetical protein [Betaproteobacteria bacterium]
MLFNIDDVPNWLKDDQGHSWLRLLNDWGYYHPSELIVGGFIGFLFTMGIIVVWRIGKLRPAAPPNLWNDDSLFEKTLGLTREELAEVGLPLAGKLIALEEDVIIAPTYDAINESQTNKKQPSLPQSITGLTLQECLLIAQFCSWRDDSLGVRMAIKRVMTEGDDQQKKMALTILETINQTTS